jgi:hypothetical protein
VGEVEVVVARSERATLRVGDVFLKIDSDQTLTDVEVAAMALAPIPTPEVLWREPLPPHGCRTTRRCRHGPVGASTSSPRDSIANASGSSRTASFLPTW